MNGAGWGIRPEPSEIEHREDGALAREVWALPLDEAFLEAFLRDLFENHWPGIRFGPMIQGAAWEWKCPGAPARISLFDGYLTVMFGNGGHFHLCIGENRGSAANPTSPELRAHRRPSKAQIFRGFDRDARPLTWGFEMWNGKGENGISIFFPSPFLNDDDTLAEPPDFSRLAVWRAVSAQWLGRAPETIDEEGKGFRKAGH
ncbi:MAG: hypothetical protein F4Y03_08695 [Alphaproteobacteria bacterium]|nr:hypothetical protein [Alphaproteobacteria bacterium]